MYERFLHKYLLFEGIIYILLIVVFAVLGVEVIVPTAIIYIITIYILTRFLMHEWRKKCDPLLKEHYPELWARYMTKSGIFGLFQPEDYLFPPPAAQYILWDKNLELKYRKDTNIIEMKNDAKLYLVFAALAFIPIILPCILLFVYILSLLFK